jgi:hypothetical protein
MNKSMTNNPAAFARAAYDRLVFQRGPAAVNTPEILAAFAQATEAVRVRAMELQALALANVAERSPS